MGKKPCAKFTPDGLIVEKYESLKKCADKNGFSREKFSNSWNNEIEVDGYIYKEVEKNNSTQKFIKQLKERKKVLKEEIHSIEKILRFHRKK